MTAECITAVILIGAGCALLPSLLSGCGYETEPRDIFKIRTRYLAVTVITSVILIAALDIICGMSETETIKALAFALITAPMAVCDIKTYKIPDALLWAAIAVRGVILAFEILTLGGETAETFIGEAVAALATLAFFSLISAAFRGGIGFGDVKLFAAAALYHGAVGIIFTVIFSMVSAIIIFAYRMISGKMKKGDFLPLVPSIYVGSVLSSVFVGIVTNAMDHGLII